MACCNQSGRNPGIGSTGKKMYNVFAVYKNYLHKV